jgi:hypothetical protein
VEHQQREFQHEQSFYWRMATQTYANAVYNYCAYWVLCSETSYAETWMNYYGDGGWSYNWDYYNSF